MNTVWCFSVVSVAYLGGQEFVYPRAPASALRLWTHHLWKLLLRFTHLQDEY